METERIILDELKNQARAEGYVVLAVPREELTWLGACLVYFLLGVLVAGR